MSAATFQFSLATQAGITAAKEHWNVLTPAQRKAFERRVSRLIDDCTPDKTYRRPATERERFMQSKEWAAARATCLSRMG